MIYNDNRRLHIVHTKMGQFIILLVVSNPLRKVFQILAERLFQIIYLSISNYLFIITFWAHAILIRTFLSNWASSKWRYRSLSQKTELNSHGTFVKEFKTKFPKYLTTDLRMIKNKTQNIIKIVAKFTLLHPVYTFAPYPPDWLTMLKSDNLYHVPYWCDDIFLH